MPRDAPDPSAVLSAFGLGGEVRAYAEISGGWSNRVFHLTTTVGDFAVKELRNTWGEPRWLEWLEEGWRLERAAIEAGIAAPAPVPAPGGGCVALVERADGSGTVSVRVHRWVEAALVPREPVTPGLAAWVGRILATQHALGLRPLRGDLYAGRAGLTTAGCWPDLVARSSAAGAPWAAVLADSEPVARRATALLEPWDPAHEVLGHGDVDQRNLLLAADGPLLCDWDVVLPRLPAHHLSEAALSMASWRAPGVVAAVLDAYRAAGGEIGALAPTDLGPALASRLGWIRFTVDRALDGRATGVALTDDGSGIPDLLEDLSRRVTLAESLPTWLP